MKKLLIVSNWKLNGDKNTIIHSLTSLTKKLSNISKCQLIIAPPIIYLDSAQNYLLNINSHIKLCAQNVDIHLSGAFTGELSALMLKDIGIQYALIGHSERRIYHKETDLYISKKFSILKKIGITPILCIGENKKEYDNKSTKSICIKQIDSIIKLIGVQSLQNAIIAYEPVWAIGSGIYASPEDTQIIHKDIRNHIAKYDQSISDNLMILYGGSVNANNAIQFISKTDIDGVLIGTASLDANNFSKIILEIEDNTYKKLIK